MISKLFLLTAVTAASLFAGTPLAKAALAVPSREIAGQIEETLIADARFLQTVADDDWRLILVGPHNVLAHEIAEDKLAVLADGKQADSRIVKEFAAFSKAAAAAGFPLVIVSAYRSISYQEVVFDRSVQNNLTAGMTEAEAIKKTEETITHPGYSEHHTGLAVDVVDEEWFSHYTTSSVLDAAYAKEPGAVWIAENAAKYGFIVRYPENKEAITGITYEPWHLRYVGRKSAAYIKKHELTLEEYLSAVKAS